MRELRCSSAASLPQHTPSLLTVHVEAINDDRLAGGSLPAFLMLLPFVVSLHASVSPCGKIDGQQAAASTGEPSHMTHTFLFGKFIPSSSARSHHHANFDRLSRRRRHTAEQHKFRHKRI